MLSSLSGFLYTASRHILTIGAKIIASHCLFSTELPVFPGFLFKNANKSNGMLFDI